MIFTEDQMKFIDSQILNQLKDIAVVKENVKIQWGKCFVLKLLL